MRVQFPRWTRLAGSIGLLSCWVLGGCGTGSAETDRLREALYVGDQAAVDAALAAGADANGQDNDGNPFLLYALYSEDGAAARALLEHGADADLPGYDTSALLIAANLGDELALAVLDNGGTWTPDEAPALLAEAVQWAPRTTERLLAQGIDPNTTAEDGQHPLVIAAGTGSLEAYRALREAGAVAQAQELIEAALSSGRPEILAAVLSDHAEASLPDSWFSQTLQMDSGALDWDWVQGLVAQHGAPSQSELNRALTGIVSQLDPTRVHALIDMGAKSPGPETLTNLIYGLEGAREARGEERSQVDFEECLDALRGIGVDLDGVDGDATALATAASQFEAGAVEALLERGADPDGAASPAEQSPLLAALRTLAEERAEFDDLEESEERSGVLVPRVVAALLSAGADPNSSTEQGVTAMQYAAVATSVDTVRQLLDAGADASRRNAKGSTAGDIARAIIAADPGKGSSLGELAIRVAGLEETLQRRRAAAREILELLGEPVSREEGTAR